MSRQPRGFGVDFRLAPGQHDFSGDGNLDGLGAEIAGDRQRPAVHDNPPRILVEVDPHGVQPRVRQIRFVVPQRDQLPVGLPQPTVLAVVDLVPVEFGQFEGRGVLRVGNLVGVQAVFGELALAALGGLNVLEIRTRR